MKYEYDSHYDVSYWNGQKVYHTPDGREHIYHGPSLTWEGFGFIADTLAPLLPKGSLLDIGCSGGDLANRMRNHGFDAYGVDISEYAVKNCVPDMRGRVGLGDITTCPEELSSYHSVSPQESKDGSRSWRVFPDKFDILMATDLLEHIYLEDLDRTFDWMLSKTNKWMFFCVATAAFDKEVFCHTRGEEIPLRFEATAIAGHVNVQTFNWWAKYFVNKGLRIDWQRGYRFQMRREQIGPWRDTMGWNMATTFFLEKP